MAETTEATAVEREVPDLEEYRARARAWLSENLARREGPPSRRSLHHYDASQKPADRALQRKLYEAGYAGISWPADYGGQGLPDSYEAAFNEEAEAYVTPNFGPLIITTYGVNVPTILAHGQPDFLRDLIPQVLAGDALFCQMFSEPTGGSDLYGARTRATRDGNRWVVNGQKTWSTFAHHADWGLCLARTDWDVPKTRGLTWFAIPTSLPGVDIRQIRQLDETDGFCEVFLDDVVIPDLYRVGEVDDGYTVNQTMLVVERGAGRTGVSTAIEPPGPLASDLAEAARTAGRVGGPVARQKLARAHVIDYVGKALTRRIALAGTAHGFNSGLAAYGKLFAGTYNPIRARLGVEIGGSGAMTWDPADGEGPDLSYAYLNGRIQSISGGTNEMQRNGISERILGMPREVSVDSKKPYSEVLRDAKNWASSPR